MPVTAAAVEMLAAHLAEYPAREVELEDRTDPRHPRRRAARLVLTTSRGEPVKRSAWSGVGARRGQGWIRAPDRPALLPSPVCVGADPFR